MKYEPINNFVILKKPGQQTTASGIVISKEETYVKVLEVVSENPVIKVGATVLVPGQQFIDFQNGFGAAKAEHLITACLE